MSETETSKAEAEAAAKKPAKRKSRRQSKLITDRAEWSFDSLRRAYEAIGFHPVGAFGLVLFAAA